MRKIDVVLLSALIVYDYSAQSLVDSDSISLGRSFTSNSINENKLTDKDYSFTPNFTDFDAFVRGAQKINQSDNTGSTMDSKTISFHQLAKVNPATAAIASQVAGEEAATFITIPMPTDDAMSIDAPEVYSTTKEIVEVNTAHYSDAVVNTDKINEQVATVADMSTFDSDNDGSYDAEDKCPGVVGVARFEGCPVPDSDADGINDEEDRCPFEKGTADSYGCPIITTSETIITDPSDFNTDIAKEKNSEFNFTVHFNKDNKILSSEDFNIVLQLTDILVRTPDAKVEIESVVNANPSLPQTPVNLLSSYFKDLGVSQNQIIIKKQTKEAKETIIDGKSKVEMRIKL